MNKYLEDNTIIICSNSWKEKLLATLNMEHLFLNIKFYTKSEFIKLVTFSYDEKTIYYLLKKYNYKINIIRMYLDNLLKVRDVNDVLDSRIVFLKNMYQELKDNDLLYEDNIFKANIKNKKIIYLQDEVIDEYEENIFKKFNVNILDVYENNYKLPGVYEFNTIDDEAKAVIKQISELIASGVDINKIKIIADPEYNNVLLRESLLYKIPISIKYQASIDCLNIGKDFIKYYDNDLNKTIKRLSKYDNKLINIIVNIINKYTFICDDTLKKELIISDLKTVCVPIDSLQNNVEIVNINYPFTDEYVFFLGFNNGFVPKIIYDENYICDSLKDKLPMKSTVLLNSEIKAMTIKQIKNIKNLWISYKKASSKGEYYPSILVNELELEKVKYECNKLKSYSVLSNKLEYAGLLDNYYKYGTIDENLKLYFSNLKIDYKSYDNNFKGINSVDLKEHLKNHLTLSYSSLNNYNKCPFRYYLSNILKLEKYEDKFEAFIGSIFHDILEKCFNNDLDVHEEIINYIKDSKRTVTIKEQYFINKVEKDISFVVDTLKYQNTLINLEEAYYEKNFVINKDKDIKVDFIGFVDKLLYKKLGSKTVVAIIDYKTGFIDIELKYLPYGLSMQLPIYLYLVKKSEIFENPVFVGFYLQYILDKDILIDHNKSYLSQKRDNLKLMGYSNLDNQYLELFDSTFNNSEIIKSMKTKKDGNFYNYAKVLNNTQIDKIIELTEQNIDNGINNILDANFAIKPKKIGNKCVGCEYCKFKDICFVEEKDYDVLEEVYDLSFLGGDEDA